MAKIGIILAMQNEFDEVIQIVKKTRKIKNNLYQGMIETDKVYIACCGIGKVNAASMTTELIIKHKIEFVIAAGVGGGASKKVEILDTIIATQTSHYDFDLKIFGHKPGQIPNEPEKYEAYKIKNNKKKKDIKFGEIISADKFITINDVEKIKKDFPNALSVDMETSAIGQVAYKYKIPFLAIRVICDLIFQNDNQNGYNKNVWKAVIKLRKSIEDIIKIL